MNIESVPIADLSPDPANSRGHSDRNLAAIRASLRRFGQQKPIVIDARGVVVAGNGTLEAARELGLEEISVVRTDLNSVDAVAYAIADNRTAELAHWDEHALAAALVGLEAEDPAAREAAGFTEEEMRALVEEFAPSGEDAARLDESDGTPGIPVHCPHCGEDFVWTPSSFVATK